MVTYFKEHVSPFSNDVNNIDIDVLKTKEEPISVVII